MTAALKRIDMAYTMCMYSSSHRKAPNRIPTCMAINSTTKAVLPNIIRNNPLIFFILSLVSSHVTHHAAQKSLVKNRHPPT